MTFSRENENINSICFTQKKLVYELMNLMGGWIDCVNILPPCGDKVYQEAEITILEYTLDKLIHMTSLTKTTLHVSIDIVLAI